MDIAVRGNHLNAAGNRMPYGITQCYATAVTFPPLCAAETGTRLSDPGGMQG